MSLNLRSVPSPSSRSEPLWKGPEKDGITYSLLSRFLVCRERFRLHVVEGLRPIDRFEQRMEYGHMWHACEEALAACDVSKYDRNYWWQTALRDYCIDLAKRYPMDRDRIGHWQAMATASFPRYVKHWEKHPDVTARTPLLQEAVFDVPYSLPSGRTVRLRGKWDAVDLIGKGKGAGVYLQENKTKSSIDQQKIARQLTGDLQSMLYLIAMSQDTGIADLEAVKANRTEIKGVRYNVIRRSAHKTVGSMLNKLDEDEGTGRIGEWFARWKVEVSTADLARFRQRTLDPILEQLYDWWDWIDSPSGRLRPFGDGDEEENCEWIRRKAIEAKKNGGSVEAVLSAKHPHPCHWQHPFGVYNVLDEGGSSDLDAYLETGSEAGLQRVDTLFKELE